MSKFRFAAEFELKAAPKIIYPYLASPNGLRAWFADKVEVLPDQSWFFEWEGDSYTAKMVAKRVNHHVKFVFQPADDAENDEQPGYLEFRLDYNELTQSSFLRVTDYSEMDDLEELNELWQQLITALREVLGSGFA